MEFSNRDKPTTIDSALDFADQHGAGLPAELLRSALHSAVQSPIEGGGQLINHVAGKDVIPSFKLLSASSHAEFGSSRWHAQQIGGGIGMALPFIAVSKTIGGGAKIAGRFTRAGEMAASFGLAESRTARLALSVTHGAASGFAFEGLLRPVDVPREDFAKARLNNATAGSITFAALSGLSGGHLKGAEAGTVS